MWELFKTFFQVGLFTIGGGYAMIPLIEQKVVDEKRWVSRDELLDLIAVAQSCPGIFAVNISIFIGNKLMGNKGALVSAIGTSLPSFLCILAIALVFQRFRENVYVEHFFRGIRPAVVALIALPVFRMAKSAKINRYNVWIPLVAAFLIWMLGVSPIFVVLAAGVAGYVYGKYLKDDFVNS
ncbi:MAG: chromate transporter [Bacteroidaceae bacterium]|jgi:chromate transporter|nr:chromate transporter [Bacteroidaceae bacterium]